MFKILNFFTISSHSVFTLFHHKTAKKSMKMAYIKSYDVSHPIFDFNSVQLIPKGLCHKPQKNKI